MWAHNGQKAGEPNIHIFHAKQNKRLRWQPKVAKAKDWNRTKFLVVVALLLSFISIFVIWSRTTQPIRHLNTKLNDSSTVRIVAFQKSMPATKLQHYATNIRAIYYTTHTHAHTYRLYTSRMMLIFLGATLKQWWSTYRMFECAWLPWTPRSRSSTIYEFNPWGDCGERHFGIPFSASKPKIESSNSKQPNRKKNKKKHSNGLPRCDGTENSPPQLPRSLTRPSVSLNH